MGKSGLAEPVKYGISYEVGCRAEDFLEEYENTAIRFMMVPKISYEEQLEEEDHSSEGIWRKAVPGELPYFSAVAFYFANRLQREWKNVPIGLIGCNWGGTSVSCWMPEEDLIRIFRPIWI